LRFFKAVFRLIRFICFSIIFMSLLAAGMGIGGFLLLNYMVKGEEVTVPNLYGMTKSEAILVLAEYELMLNPDIEEITNVNAAVGIVIEQRPRPDAKVKKGRKISLGISSGPEQIYIPDVTKQPEETVLSDLRSAGLNTGNRAAVYHPSIPEGVIIAQDPLPGERIIQGKKVDLLVSLGPRVHAFVMPNLIGMDMRTARNRAGQEKFILDNDHVTKQQTADQSKWNRILEQRPLPGAKVMEGERITLTAGSSGESIGTLWMIDVSFPVPAFVERSQLCLLVWDDTSIAFDQPIRIPLDLKFWQQEINRTIPVFGDALVTLSQTDDSSPNVLPLHHHFQYFEAK